MGMELVYLMGSIVYSTLTSAILSLSLAFRIVISCLHATRTVASSENENDGGPEEKEDDRETLWMYEGEVRHVRRRPVYHVFDYNVRYALIDLDRFVDPHLRRHHLSAEEARRITGTRGPVLLLTIPTSVGYEQNPLSVYYCFDGTKNLDNSSTSSCRRDSIATSQLTKCIAEVTNTPWGERVTFVFNPGSDSVAKPLHVSPFMDMLGTWLLRTDVPADKLFIAISVQHPTLGNYFTATLNAKRVSCSSSSARQELHFWLIPQKVAVWIYWQALKLWWKNVSFVQHPKYSCPSYRRDALQRDTALNKQTGTDLKKRFCVWKDAQWPWT